MQKLELMYGVLRDLLQAATWIRLYNHWLFMTVSSRTEVFTAQWHGQSSWAERPTGIHQVWNIHKQNQITDAWCNSTPPATHNPALKKILPSLGKKKNRVKPTQPEPELYWDGEFLFASDLQIVSPEHQRRKMGYCWRTIIRCQEKKRIYYEVCG